MRRLFRLGFEDLLPRLANPVSVIAESPVWLNGPKLLSPVMPYCAFKFCVTGIPSTVLSVKQGGRPCLRLSLDQALQMNLSRNDCGLAMRQDLGKVSVVMALPSNGHSASVLWGMLCRRRAP